VTRVETHDDFVRVIEPDRQQTLELDASG